MQENLWGEEEPLPLQRQKRPTPKPALYTPKHCEWYGHTWEYFGITGLKQCTICHIQGYCPVCTLIPPVKEAQPFYCTRHTPTESAVHHAV